MRTRWLSQISAAASRLQTIRIMAKPKMIGSHSLAGSISALSSSLARSNSLDQRVSGLSAPENCFSKLARVPPIRPEHAFFGGRLGFFGGVAQLLQIGQQLGALLVVFQRLDHFVQGLPERFLCFGLGFAGAEQARQPDRLGRRQRQQRHQADEEQAGQGKQTSEH